LEKEKIFFYAYECIKSIYDLKKKTHLDEDSTKLLNKLINRIKKGISDYINKSVKLFKNLEKEDDTNIKKFDKLEKLIKDISDNSYQINDNDDDDDNNNNIENNDKYLYLINKNWFSKLIKFMEDFKSIRDNNQNKNKYKEYFKKVFNSINILNNYLNADNEKNKYYAFPGPVDNFSIIDWKDTLDDPLNVDENIFLKSDFKDYYLLKKSDFELLKDIFGVTNIIKRKKDNLDFIQIKSIIFDKRFKDKKNNNLLKKRTFQIKKTSTISEFKEKIIRCVENLFNKENNNEEIKVDKNKKYNIHFFILNKQNKNILIEMCISFVNNIPAFDCTYLKKIQISDDENISKLFSLYNQKKNILIIETQAENDSLFFKEIDNDKYICTQCKKEIDSEENIYKCKICHMSLFCSEKCAKDGKDHDLLDKILKEKFFIEEFNLNKLFSKEFKSLFIEDNSSVKGKVGLKNNGNTCYMNSSLQCLSNTNDLTKYFLKKLYEKDINFANKLGTHGSISSIYYDFIRKMWYGHETVISPIEFLKKFKHNFEENKQHDAQEFLNILLDKLHEDLNHIKYQYNKDFPEEYKKIKEENSIIKDLFDGLFKSEITCEECKESSINIESFRFLSIPIIRSKKRYSFKIFYDTKLIYFNLEYDPNYTLKEIKEYVIKFLKTKGEQVIDLEIVIFKENKMIEYHGDEEKIKSIYNGKREIAFYKKTNTSKDAYKYFLYLIEENKSEKNENRTYCSLSYPLFFEVAIKNKTFVQFQTEIINRLKKTNFIDNKKDFKEKDKVFDFRIFMNKQKCNFCKKEEAHFCLIDVLKTPEIRKVFEKTGFLREKIGCLYVTSESFNKKNPVYLTEDLGKEDEDPYFFSKHISLKHMIHFFTNNDSLEGDNKWNCPKSKTHLKSKRKLQIYKAPNYLIIQLKRFKTEGYNNSFSGEKNNEFVSYPIKNLDLSNYIVGPDKNNVKYDLYGVIEHSGTLNSGHYMAICKNDDKWILYNDSIFEEINNPVTENAYILFYKRQNLDIIED
jgi:ubiquitin C-terminal hydrolase